jgi:protein PhnA
LQSAPFAFRATRWYGLSFSTGPKELLTMSQPTNCPKCNSENIYQDGNLWICPECSYEWSPFAQAAATEAETTDNSIRDANGNVLADGDSVIVLKDLKIKGSSSVVKGGTKVRNIRLTDAGDGHDIACKIDGIGAINLKSEFVRKA